MLMGKIDSKDITYILENPWNITESEWELADSNRETELSNILGYLELTVADGYSKIWKTADNKPIALLGGFKVADKKYETFFIASKHMDEHSLKISFDMRKILKEKSAQYKDCTLGIYSTSDHPHQITWFRFIGFKYVPEGNNGKARYFEYAAPAV